METSIGDHASGLHATRPGHPGRCGPGRHEVVWRDGEIVELGTVWDEESGIDPLAGLADVPSAATDVNDRGTIVGWMEPVRSFPVGRRRQRRAFLWRNRLLTDLGELPIVQPAPQHATEALAINADGLVVGRSYGYAFIYHDGEMLSLGAPCTDVLLPRAPDRPVHPME